LSAISRGRPQLSSSELEEGSHATNSSVAEDQTPNGRSQRNSQCRAGFVLGHVQDQQHRRCAIHYLIRITGGLAHRHMAQLPRAYSMSCSDVCRFGRESHVWHNNNARQLRRHRHRCQHMRSFHEHLASAATFLNVHLLHIALHALCSQSLSDQPK